MILENKHKWELFTILRKFKKRSDELKHKLNTHNLPEKDLESIIEEIKILKIDLYNQISEVTKGKEVETIKIINTHSYPKERNHFIKLLQLIEEKLIPFTNEVSYPNFNYESIINYLTTRLYFFLKYILRITISASIIGFFTILRFFQKEIEAFLE